MHEIYQFNCNDDGKNKCQLKNDDDNDDDDDDDDDNDDHGDDDGDDCFFQMVDQLKCFSSKPFFPAATTISGYNHDKPLTHNGQDLQMRQCAKFKLVNYCFAKVTTTLNTASALGNC